jgi:hypothetical protein
MRLGSVLRRGSGYKKKTCQESSRKMGKELNA